MSDPEQPIDEDYFLQIFGESHNQTMAALDWFGCSDLAMKTLTTASEECGWVVANTGGSSAGDEADGSQLREPQDGRYVALILDTEPRQYQSMFSTAASEAGLRIDEEELRRLAINYDLNFMFLNNIFPNQLLPSPSDDEHREKDEIRRAMDFFGGVLKKHPDQNRFPHPQLDRGYLLERFAHGFSLTILMDRLNDLVGEPGAFSMTKTLVEIARQRGRSKSRYSMFLSSMGDPLNPDIIKEVVTTNSQTYDLLSQLEDSDV